MSKERSPRAVCSTTIGTSGNWASVLGLPAKLIRNFLVACPTLAGVQPCSCASAETRGATMTLPRTNPGATTLSQSVVLEDPPGEIWEALTADSILSEWLAPEVEL